MYIGLNKSLTDISQIATINPNSLTHIGINENEALEDCAVYSICTFLNINPNNANIGRNKNSCKTKDDVINACKGLSTDEQILPKIILAPSPTTGKLSINTDIPIKSIEIYNLTGQCLQKGHSKKLDLSNFADGIYLVKLIGRNNRIHLERILKKTQ